MILCDHPRCPDEGKVCRLDHARKLRWACREHQAWLEQELAERRERDNARARARRADKDAQVSLFGESAIQPTDSRDAPSRPSRPNRDRWKQSQHPRAPDDGGEARR